jgi:SAM-dependent methyltransferase
VTDVHEAAAVGYARAGDDYERGRPGYPPAAVAAVVAALALAPREPVLELAAGTGKLTRLLAARSLAVTALEPVEGMRTRLAATLSDVRVVPGTAERIPAADGEFAGAVAATAFHWFDPSVALPEIARVLRRGSTLVVLWNVRDRSQAWIGALSQIVHARRAPGVPRYPNDASLPAIEASALFGPLSSAVVEHEHEVDLDGLLARVSSVSYIAALPERERAAVLDEVRELASTHPDLRGRERIVIPYRTELYWCRTL